MIELLVVMALVAVLVAISLPALRGARERSASARARSELFLLAQALEDYRRHFGDYPQTGDFAQASLDRSAPLKTTDAQVRLFNALNGFFGPTDFSVSNPIRSRRFLDETKFTVERSTAADLSTEALAVACVLDPWDRRYLYFYKSASNPQEWRGRGYVLFSAGPNGNYFGPDPTTGLSSTADSSAPENADNLYAGSAPP